MTTDGKDEHGALWELSAKAMLYVFLLGGYIQRFIHAPQQIDWTRSTANATRHLSFDS